MVIAIIGDVNSTAGSLVLSSCHDRTDLVITSTTNEIRGLRNLCIIPTSIDGYIYYEPPTPKFYQDFHALQVCFKGKQLHNWNLGRSSKINKRPPMKDARINKRKNFIKQLNRKLWQA